MLNIDIDTLFDDRYLITGRLGEGGMGLVFAAQDSQRGDLPCAIKVLQYQHQEKTHSIRRLTQERSVMAKLRHEHIVDVFDVVSSSQSDQHYLVMPLLKGSTFNQWIDQQSKEGNPITLGDFLRLICQTLDALHHAHRMGVVHRDLKPDNLFVCIEEGKPHVKVLDFGIAKDLTDQENITAESQNAMIGTPRYMSPEQIKNQEITPQADLYALAILTYERIAGFHPFETEECQKNNPMRGMPSPIQMSWHHLNSIPAPLKGLEMLGGLLISALEKEPQARPKSAHLMCNKIKKWLSLHQEVAAQTIPLDAEAAEFASYHSGEMRPQVTPTPHPSLQGTDPKAQKSQDSLQPQTYNTHSSQDSASFKMPGITRSSKRTVPKTIPASPTSSQAVTIAKWILRVALFIYLIAWVWYLSGRPHIPLVNGILAPFFELICGWGVSINGSISS